MINIVKESVSSQKKIGNIKQLVQNIQWSYLEKNIVKREEQISTRKYIIKFKYIQITQALE